ncbi:hypothetical protein PR202_ga12968 [Eleusine coracana subsp. coracana]|uniref:Uncharacterized protein n=1 Tax=Eleusine coracana subsp. coracana TaxID=191504 RepID=A0AAV5CDH5_ELECO|nr:hypothetical protein PR202_ga12968 [Eleusine coracana subsp. coracana]
MGGVPALGWWLMAVGTVRLVLTLYGYLDTAALGAATYAKAESKLLTLLPLGSIGFDAKLDSYGMDAAPVELARPCPCCQATLMSDESLLSG